MDPGLWKRPGVRVHLRWGVRRRGTDRRETLPRARSGPGLDRPCPSGALTRTPLLRQAPGSLPLVGRCPSMLIDLDLLLLRAAPSVSARRLLEGGPGLSASRRGPPSASSAIHHRAHRCLRKAALGGDANKRICIGRAPSARTEASAESAFPCTRRSVPSIDRPLCPSRATHCRGRGLGGHFFSF